jgi:hypothetical protein
MWIQMANKPRRQDGIVTIQQAFHNMAQGLGLYGVHIPITPDVVTKIRSVALEMSKEDNLTTSIHPFTFAYLDTSEIAEAYAVAEHYKMLHDDKGAPTLQDAIILATPGRVKMPKSLSEAHIYFQNLWRSMFLWAAITRSPRHTMPFGIIGALTSSIFSEFTRNNLAFSQHWRISLWFAQQALENAPLEVPNFASLPSHYYNTRANTGSDTPTGHFAYSQQRYPSSEPRRGIGAEGVSNSGVSNHQNARLPSAR